MIYPYWAGFLLSTYEVFKKYNTKLLTTSLFFNHETTKKEANKGESLRYGVQGVMAISSPGGSKYIGTSTHRFTMYFQGLA